MPDPVIPPAPTPAAPAPAAPAPKATFDQNYEAALKGTDAPESKPTPSPAPQPTAAQKRLVKAKLDKEEKEYDWDEWTKEQFEKGRAKDVIERDYALDHVRDRTRKEAIEAARKSWNAFLNDENFDIVEAPGTKHGWKVVARQVVTPAPTDTDPLAKEETELRAKIKGADAVDPEWLVRLAEIRGERAKLDAIKEWESRQAKQVADVEQKDSISKAQTWMRSEVDRLVAARAKSFGDSAEAKEFLDWVKDQAFQAGDSAGRSAQSAAAATAAAQAIIFRHADYLDKRDAAFRSTLTQEPPNPTRAPVIGAAPSGGGSSGRKTFDQAWEDAIKTL